MSVNTTMNQTNNNVSHPGFYEIAVPEVTILSILYGAMALVAFVGNVLVVYVIARTPRMRTVTNMFIANLATADIIIGVFSVPFQYQAALLQRWVLPDELCAFAPFFSNVSVTVSVLTLTLIAVDRYVAILYPLKPRMSWRKAILLTLTVWLVAISTSLPQFLFKVVMDGDEKVCGCPYCMKNPSQWTYYNYGLVLLQYCGPLVVICYSYFRIGYRIWGNETPGCAQSQRDQQINRQKKKVVKMLLIVVTLFAVCWLPLQTYNLLCFAYPAVNNHEHIQIIWLCSNWLAMSNSCYNPFIYNFYNAKYRAEFRRVFYRWCRCKEPEPLSGDTTIGYSQAHSRVTIRSRTPSVIDANGCESPRGNKKPSYRNTDGLLAPQTNGKTENTSSERSLHSRHSE